uniref:Exonuclease n=1 Tax=Fervidicoccus fontis TaxID=683846 RepID=A0A7J3ZKZ9_9CREN
MKKLIAETGAILLGRKFEVDGFAGRPFRVVTHFHSDHVVGLSASKRSSISIIATRATLESLEVLSYGIPEHKSLPLDYRRSLELENERITLIESRHVFGSCQVLVEGERGELYGYTSDFKLPGTPIMRDLDYLVVDATYGAPYMVRRFKREVNYLFADLVTSLLSKGKPVWVLAYYGKIQEAMEILRRHGIEAPFLMPEKVYRLTRVAVKHGLRINDFHSDRSSEAKEVVHDRWYVYFQHANAARRGPKDVASITLTGWIFDEPIKKASTSSWESYYVALSDHADFEDTLYYVEEARPKVVVIDAYRSSQRVAKMFARELSRFKLKSLVLPRVDEALPSED